MRSSSKTSRTKSLRALAALVCVAVAAVAAPETAPTPRATTRPAARADKAPGPAGVDPKDLDTVVGSALRFLRTRQERSGAFGTVQPQLQTSLAVLAMLSAGGDRAAADRDRIDKAVDFLVRSASRAGDLGDPAFRVESHALATTAVLCALPRLRDGGLKTRAAKLVYRALRLTRRMQDRSSSTTSRGGWKMDGFKGRENDRRASAWALLSYHAARQYGLDVRSADLDRGARFMLGAYKAAAEKSDPIGGFSVDAEGLAVASVSAMGGWVISRLRPNAGQAEKNRQWLNRHPAAWSGPNYFYTNFFRIRVWKFADASGPAFRRCLRRLYLQIRENQGPDGAVRIPPGNAQNTVVMGPVFATAMAVLILNAGDSRLVFDEDYRARAPF